MSSPVGGVWKEKMWNSIIGYTVRVSDFHDHSGICCVTIEGILKSEIQDK